MKLKYLWLVTALLGLPFTANAEVCQAKFFHNGGEIEVVGSGLIQVSAKLNFSQVKKTSTQQCQALVKGYANYALLGMLSGVTDVDHVMRVDGVKTSLSNPGAVKKPGDADIDVQMLSLFGYGEPIRAAGQRFPAQSFRLAIGDPRRGPTTPVTVRMGEKTVGAQQSIETAAGQQSCWPVRYSRGTDPTVVSVKGAVIPLPNIQSQVTDWFCPSLNLVMKQEIMQSGQRSVIEVKTLR
ncbi:MAG: hypothetical protein NBV66_02635 [Burkholderiaceae bacterium]|nr:hypothetical protein [Burkholderiaceae bacterium]